MLRRNTTKPEKLRLAEIALTDGHRCRWNRSGPWRWALQSEDLECLPKSHERRAQGQGTWFDTYPGRGAKVKQRVLPSWKCRQCSKSRFGDNSGNILQILSALPRPPQEASKSPRGPIPVPLIEEPHASEKLDCLPRLPRDESARRHAHGSAVREDRNTAPLWSLQRHWSCAPAAARIYPLVADNAGSAYTPALKVGCGRSCRPARRPATLRVRIPFKRLIFGRAMLLREEPNCAPPPCVRTSCRPRKSSGSKPPRPAFVGCNRGAGRTDRAQARDRAIQNLQSGSAAAAGASTLSVPPRRFPPPWSVIRSTRSMHRAREKSGVATIVTRRLAYAP